MTPEIRKKQNKIILTSAAMCIVLMIFSLVILFCFPSWAILIGVFLIMTLISGIFHFVYMFWTEFTDDTPIIG